MKRELQKVSQELLSKEDMLRDAVAEKERMGRDYEAVKKKYADAKGEAQTAYKGLENYQVILAKFEDNLKSALKAKEVAESERDKALEEIRLVRQRYVKIVGITDDK